MEATALADRPRLHRRAVRLEWFTVGWNVVEAVVAITAGVIAGSVALIGFGADSGIEVLSAVALLWRLRSAGAGATDEEHAHAERRALYAVAATFFLLSAYIAFEAISSLVAGEEPDTSTVGIVLATLSLAVMPTLAVLKQRTGARDGQPRAPGRRGRDVGLRVPVARAAGGRRPLRGLRLVVGRSRGRARDAAGDRLARLRDARGGT